MEEFAGAVLVAGAFALAGVLAALISERGREGQRRARLRLVLTAVAASSPLGFIQPYGLYAVEAFIPALFITTIAWAGMRAARRRHVATTSNPSNDHGPDST
jgi:hypothetical protein